MKKWHSCWNLNWQWRKKPVKPKMNVPKICTKLVIYICMKNILQIWQTNPEKARHLLLNIFNICTAHDRTRRSFYVYHSCPVNWCPYVSANMIKCKTTDCTDFKTHTHNHLMTLCPGLPEWAIFTHWLHKQYNISQDCASPSWGYEIKSQVQKYSCVNTHKVKWCKGKESMVTIWSPLCGVKAKIYHIIQKNRIS